MSALLKLAYLFFFFGLAGRDDTVDADARGVEVLDAVKAKEVLGSDNNTAAAAAIAAVNWRCIVIATALRKTMAVMDAA